MISRPRTPPIVAPKQNLPVALELRPTFLWPDVSGRDTGEAPPLNEWWARYRQPEAPDGDGQNLENGLTQFLEALLGAEHEVCIVDPHLPGRLVLLLELAMSQSSVERLRVLHNLTGSEATKVEAGMQAVRVARLHARPRRPVGSVDWLRLRAPVHDRLAIVDGEFWHFGGTVGGLHAAITGASRGWSAGETRALGLFDELWRNADERRR